jgi:hypothetical protein
MTHNYLTARDCAPGWDREIQLRCLTIEIKKAENVYRFTAGRRILDHDHGTTHDSRPSPSDPRP